MATMNDNASLWEAAAEAMMNPGTLDDQDRAGGEGREEDGGEEDEDEQEEYEQEEEDGQEGGDEDGQEEDEDGGDEDEQEGDEEQITLSSEELDQLAATELAEYGVESFDDLRRILDQQNELIDRVESLQAENEQLRSRPAEPVFKNARQKSVYDFVTAMNGDVESSIARYAGLWFMDVDKLDAKSALFERFYLDEHSDLPREKAMRLFDREYADRYESDDDEEIGQIRLEKDVKRARKFLSDKQAEIKAAAEQEGGQEDQNLPQAVAEGIEQSLDTLEESFDGFDSIVFPLDDNPRNAFRYTLTREQRQQLFNVAAGQLRNPANYDGKGKLALAFDPDELKVSLARVLFGEDIESKLTQHAYTLGMEARARKMAGRQPTRKSTVAGRPVESMEDAWTEAAKNVKTLRN